MSIPDYTEILQYDGRTKQMIKESLYSFLYAPVKKQFQARIDEIIIRNTALGKYDHKSFVYKGELYSCDPKPAPLLKRNRIVKEMIPMMDAYLAEIKELNEKELPYVFGFITQVLNSSNDLQDYMKVLPASIHRPLKTFVDRCPCKTRHLSDSAVSAIQEQNQHSINLMKQRMVQNLLI